MNHTLPRGELVWTPFLSLFRKELLRFWRVIGQTLLIPLVNSTLYLMIFGVSLGDHIQVSNWPYLAFLIPGLLVMGVMNNAFQNSSSSIATSKFHGDLEDLRVVPLSSTQIVAAMSVAGMFRGILVGTITFSVGEFFYWWRMGAALVPEHFAWLLFFLVTGGLSFSLLGIIVGFQARSIDQLSTIGGFILLPLMYLGGVFFPLESLHPFWRSLSRANPMLYFVNGVRHGILGQADISAYLSASFSLLSVAVLFCLALRMVKQGRYGRW